MSTDHPYTWNDVRLRSADGLAVGDTWINPGTGAAYFADKNGRVHGAGIAHEMPMGGIAWTVTAREGKRITARSQTGATLAGEFPNGQRVLTVVPPEPVGTVLAVNSHRARERLERALGRKPAAYYDRAMRRGGKFVVLYGDEVTRALEITSITRTRLKPDDVAMCLGSRTTLGDDGLRVTYDDSEHARRDADRAAAGTEARGEG
jgi:hypothetical protein